MSDRYMQIMQSPVGQRVIASLGLPVPPDLERADGPWQTQGLKGMSVLFGAAAGSSLIQTCLSTLNSSGADVFVPTVSGGLEDIKRSASANTVPVRATTEEDESKFSALVFDGSGITTAQEMSELHAFLSPNVRRLKRNGRIIILGRTPESASDAEDAAVMRGLEGVVRSLGKEFGKKGITAQHLYVEPGAEARAEAALRFFLSKSSAFITGQALRITGLAAGDTGNQWEASLSGKVVVVTGAARGIGAGIAEVMAREGAKVICLDRPGEEENLQKVADAIGGEVLAADITDANAPQLIADYCNKNHKGLDAIVHNAGVTRDKTIARMKPELWNMVLEINLAAIARVNKKLLADKVIRKGGRIICVSSISGIAGNMGQTNYAASKAGLIGYVATLSQQVADQGITVNAVAPGFIETQMTAAIPFAIREVGRRFNSLSQGGLPVDVAEAITFFATPGAVGASGNVLRICGQNMLGA